MRRRRASTPSASLHSGDEPVRRLSRDELPLDATELARFLIGTTLVHDHGGHRLSGRIVETEAYLVGDAASHAFRGRTARNGAMFLKRGHAYVYISYGCWPMLNVSAGEAGVGTAVLLRALEPIEGIEAMRESRAAARLLDIARGPGRLAGAMRVTLADDGADLCGDGPLWLGAPRSAGRRDRHDHAHRHHQGRGTPAPLLRARQSLRQRAAAAERRLSTWSSRHCSIADRICRPTEASGIATTEHLIGKGESAALRQICDIGAAPTDAPGRSTGPTSMSATHILINLDRRDRAAALGHPHGAERRHAGLSAPTSAACSGAACSTRFHAFLAGLGVTAALQSSTATALMAMSFAGAGSVDLGTALAVMLGANVGTTLIVQVLSFDITLVFPMLIAVGVFAFRRGQGHALPGSRARC